MDDIFPVLFILGILAIGVAVAVLVYRREKKRTEELQALADRLGFSFSAKPDNTLVKRLDHLHLFSRGHARKMYNRLQGQVAGVQTTLFDYTYTTGGGKHRHTHQQSVLLFESERLQLPLFMLRPEGLFDKIAGAFGSQDVDFDSHPAFSERYVLRGNDEAAIRALFADSVLDYYTRHSNLCAEGQGQELVHYYAGRRIDSSAMNDFIQEGLDVLDLFLAHDDPLANLDLLGFGLDLDAEDEEHRDESSLNRDESVL